MDAPRITNLATVENAAKHFAQAGQTPNAIRCNIFKADDRLNSRGEKIHGNGLSAYGAIIRRGRRILIDLDRYGAWLAGESPALHLTLDHGKTPWIDKSSLPKNSYQLSDRGRDDQPQNSSGALQVRTEIR